MMDPARLAIAMRPMRERTRLSDDERLAVAWMYQDERPLAEIAGGIGRPIGTVKTVVASLRRAGLVDRRYRVRVAL